MSPWEDLAPGDRIEGAFKMVTAERLRWYGDGMLTAAAGSVTLVGSNIHTDEEYARSQGLEAPIADGMLATNWISSLLVATFGTEFFTGGYLRTKYIKPTYVGVLVRPVLVCRSRVEHDGATTFGFEAITEDDAGEKLTDGEAEVRVPGGA